MEEKRQMSEMETSEKWPCDLANLPVAVDILTPLFKIRHETCALALNPRAFGYLCLTYGSIAVSSM